MFNYNSHSDASEITEKARIRMDKILKLCNKYQIHPYYCDTDGDITCSGNVPQEFIDELNMILKND